MTAIWFNLMAAKANEPSLTRRQREIFEFLKDKILNRGYGPTVREIGEEFSIKSPNGVMCHLKALERKGLIQRESNISRAIRLPNQNGQKTSLPLLGTAVSGGPIQSAVSSDERIEFEQLFEGSDKACIRVRGAAFHSLGISDGDILIVNRSAEVAANDLVAILDDRHSVTLCRISENGQTLVPAIAGAYPTPTRQVLGVVVGVVRQMKQPTINGHTSSTTEPAADAPNPTSTPPSAQNGVPWAGPNGTNGHAT